MRESKKKANDKYFRKTIYQLNIKLNKNTDADLIEKVEAQENKNLYIKELIRKDKG